MGWVQKEDLQDVGFPILCSPLPRGTHQQLIHSGHSGVVPVQAPSHHFLQPLQPQAKPWHASHRGQGGSEHPPHTPTVPRAGPWGLAVWELTYLVSLDKLVLGDLGLQGRHLVRNVALQ